MIGLLPEDIAVVVLGPGGAALGRRLRTALAGARLHGPRAHPGDWDESYDRVSTHIGALFDAGPKAEPESTRLPTVRRSPWEAGLLR